MENADRHAVCYGISPLDSNCMKSSNPYSGIYEATTSRTLDKNGGNPSCNQGGLIVVICRDSTKPARPTCYTPWDVESKHIMDINGVSEALHSGECRWGGGEKCVLYENGLSKKNSVLCFKERAGKPGGGKGILIGENKTFTLSTLQQDVICYSPDAINEDRNATASREREREYTASRTTRTTAE